MGGSLTGPLRELRANAEQRTAGVVSPYPWERGVTLSKFDPASRPLSKFDPPGQNAPPRPGPLQNWRRQIDLDQLAERRRNWWSDLLKETGWATAGCKTKVLPNT